MKLLLCTKCKSIFNLSETEEKTCSCGKTKGKYKTPSQAEYEGEYAVPISIGNNSLFDALEDQKETRTSSLFYKARFEAWVDPLNSTSFVKK